MLKIMSLVVVLPACFCSVLGADDHHSSIPQDKYHQFDTQKVSLQDFDADGLILAIGGGGEGVMGQLKGGQVVAIDISARELMEAPGSPLLKIVMDARDTGFLDGTFRTAASFFTMMYIDGSDHRQVFDEVYRVLTPGGRFLIWDAVFGERPEGKLAAIVPLSISLPDKTINTGYGVSWPTEPHDPAYYSDLAREAGFIIKKGEMKQDWFYLELQKPAAQSGESAATDLSEPVDEGLSEE